MNGDKNMIVGPFPCDKCKELRIEHNSHMFCKAYPEKLPIEEYCKDREPGIECANGVTYVPKEECE